MFAYWRRLYRWDHCFCQGVISLLSIFYQPWTQGYMYNRNFLLHTAIAPYLISLDDDAHFVLPRPLEIIQQHFEKYSRCGLIVCRVFLGKNATWYTPNGCFTLQWIWICRLWTCVAQNSLGVYFWLSKVLRILWRRRICVDGAPPKTLGNALVSRSTSWPQGRSSPTEKWCRLCLSSAKSVCQ